jgi:hypothetical protein
MLKYELNLMHFIVIFMINYSFSLSLMHTLGYQCVFVLYIHLNMHLNLYSIEYLPSLAIIAKSFNDIIFLLVYFFYVCYW